jgi:hypothetical protein
MFVWIRTPGVFDRGLITFDTIEASVVLKLLFSPTM